MRLAHKERHPPGSQVKTAHELIERIAVGDGASTRRRKLPHRGGHSGQWTELSTGHSWPRQPPRSSSEDVEGGGGEADPEAGRHSSLRASNAPGPGPRDD